MSNDNALKILLVDDFEMVRMMLRNTLKRIGFENVEEAQDGKEALLKMQEAQKSGKPYGMIFCDWSMPEVTGLEVLEICRASEHWKTVPFIMVTAESEQEFVVKALRAGANEYLIKPISAELLQKKIEKILSKTAEKAS